MKHQHNNTTQRTHDCSKSENNDNEQDNKHRQKPPTPTPTEAKTTTATAKLITTLDKQQERKSGKKKKYEVTHAPSQSLV